MQNVPMSNQFYLELKNAAGLKQLWARIVDHLEANHSDPEIIRALIPKGMTRVIPNFHRLGIRQLIYYLNTIRTLDNARNFYVPGGKLEATGHFFGASQSTEAFDKNQWAPFFREPLTVHTINGDHFSIFKVPGVMELANIFDRVVSRHT